MVFGQVIAGKEVVKEIEELDTDKKDRPMQDARIVNSGELMLKKKKTKYEFSNECISYCFSLGDLFSYSVFLTAVFLIQDILAFSAAFRSLGLLSLFLSFLMMS